MHSIKNQATRNWNNQTPRSHSRSCVPREWSTNLCSLVDSDVLRFMEQACKEARKRNWNTQKVECIQSVMVLIYGAAISYRPIRSIENNQFFACLPSLLDHSIKSTRKRKIDGNNWPIRSDTWTKNESSYFENFHFSSSRTKEKNAFDAFQSHSIARDFTSVELIRFNWELLLDNGLWHKTNLIWYQHGLDIFCFGWRELNENLEFVIVAARSRLPRENIIFSFFSIRHNILNTFLVLRIT